MNTEKVKNIVIILLTVIIVVFSSLIFISESAYTLSSAQEQAIFKVLNQNGIGFYTNIIKKFKPMRSLSMSRYHYNLDELSEVFFGGQEFLKLEDDNNIMFVEKGSQMVYSSMDNSVDCDIPAGYATEEFIHAGLTKASAEEIAEKYCRALVPFFDGMALYSSEQSGKGYYIVNYREKNNKNAAEGNDISVRVSDLGIIRVRFVQAAEGNDGFNTDQLSAAFFGGESFTKTENEWNITYTASTKQMLYSFEENTITHEIPAGYVTEDFINEGLTKASAQELSNAYCKELVPFYDSMELYSAVPTNKDYYIVSYRGKFDEYAIYSNYIKVRVAERGVIQVKYAYAMAEGFVGEPADIYSGDEATMALINYLNHSGVNDDGIILSEMKLLYFDESGRESKYSQKAAPCYCFTLTINKVMFNYIFNAYTNSFIKYEVVR